MQRTNLNDFSENIRDFISKKHKLNYYPIGIDIVNHKIKNNRIKFIKKNAIEFLKYSDSKFL